MKVSCPVSCSSCGKPRTATLTDMASAVATPPHHHHKPQRAATQLSKPRNGKGETNQLSSTPKASLPFHTVWINGDSHGRDIAELVQSVVTRDTTVEGACRPGAKLQTVNSDATPPTGSCYVFIAGTNYLAAGQQNNIYMHFELCITAKLKTAKETELINAYIEELCARHSGAVVLDFNLIRRGVFTRHGMHLKTKSKRLLELDHIPGAAPSSPPTDNRRQSSASRKSLSAGVTELRTLP
ncbi:hypothetical protein J6590_079143 [Homalodisca vitripennis]|nr:hypothetical protein J6590_079143 [Homalodisca vitripennis]